MPRVVLKLGGSVVTDKAGDCAIRRDRIAECAVEIARRPGIQVALVHGAGSCGHPQAHRHRLDRGVPPGDVTGIAETHHAVADLNRAVVDALRAAGREAVGIHPLGHCVAAAGRLEHPDWRPVALLLSLGVTPVLHGDVVMDTVRGASIVSGDQLVASLARSLSPDRVGLATDVPGVLDVEGAVVGRMRRGEGRGLAGGSRSTDVTGGMEGKLAELLALAEAGIGSSIFHASRIGDFLDGRPHGGTTVEGGM
ncbi:MAG: isopentenyl phosphate kinase family protein [Methanomicrobiales archaeon]|nr:isopentenyl phosphate kinase family protein [Methanomicrobiales archaeon]